jgi:hypothetical protein
VRGWEEIGGNCRMLDGYGSSWEGMASDGRG